ncbi:cytochrome c oxidase subunit 2A [Oceanobacillus alkalisoli]|nr:cytochrome c oxidase subunit 2A [Oceanobacillus alkalisoli]MCF3941548.1 cytochrome c oxidase subunit 2A [Oceanobacillus alkalisoli]MCG5102882.1 cytochrome c oxidase subunit 2A [Oceanobacillus alkalisoli]
MTTEKKKQLESSPENEPNLKGTLISVSVVGIFILVTWFGVFMLFLSR